jgi:septal ring factor EnvC (AmiA/AmiB activator)
VWGKVSAILTDPEKLRTGLDEMIERERAQMLGDPVKEAAALGRRLGEIKSRRSRYQEMAAAGLIDFDELRERLAAIEDERQDTERTLEASRHRTEHLERLEQNRRVLLEEYAGAMPERLADLPPEKRHRVYRMMRLRANLAPSGDLEISGDVMPASFCRTETPYLPH